MIYHNPVLLKESISGLRINPSGVYADLTYGGGGHSRELLSQLGDGKVFAFDQDSRAIENRIDDSRLTLINGNFRYMIQFLRYHKALPVDGVLADLGVSSHQIDIPARGFSTRADAPLDMRMNTEQELSAAKFLEQISEDDLEHTLRAYGDIPNSRKIAKAIIAKRAESKGISSTFSLIDAVRHFVPARFENKFMAKLFQAVRIAVNDEVAALKEMLVQCADAIKPGGRLVVISYHSLEDRIVKHYLRTGNFEDKPDKDFFGNINAPFSIVNRKAITPSPEELAANSRARSAKLRIGERN